MFSVENDKDLEDNKKPSIRKPLSNKKKYIIIGIICAVILLIGYLSYRYYQNNYVYLKEDITKEIVYPIYTRKNNKKTNTEVPKINIKSNKIEKINKDIYKKMGTFLAEETNAASYGYEINGDVLSVVIEMIDYTNPDVPEFHFKTYNVNLNTLELMSDKELLKLYGVKEKEVQKSIEKKFKYFYKDELKKGYLDKNECNYKCFLELRNIKNYSSNLEYYISDGKLYAYKEFVVISLYNEEEYYREKDFLFLIKE